MTEQDRQAFLAERRQGIGGSDVAAIFGLDPYKNAVELYHEKRGDVEDGPPTPDMERGIALEPKVAEIYTEVTGRPLRRQPARAHPDLPWMRCNIDRQITHTDGAEYPGATPGVWEAKCPRTRPFGKIEREGLPKHIILQLQHNMGVWGYEWAAVAIFSAERWKLLHFDVAFEPTLWASLVEAEERFWHKYVLAGVAPPEEVPDIDVPAYDADALVVKREDAAWVSAVGRLRYARELRAEADDVHELAKQQVIELMGEADAVEGGGLRVYYRQRAGRRSLDKDALKRAAPIDREKLLAWLAEDDPAYVTMFQTMLRERDMLVDFDAFEKQGKPYMELRSYPLRPEE